MHLKKHLCHALPLLLLCGCTDQCTRKYIEQENEGYYTKNPYKLGISDADIYKLFKKSTRLLSADEITIFRKKLLDKIPKWRATGTEPEPYQLFNDFLAEEIAPHIIKKLKEKQGTTPLENYYTSLGKLFQAPTEGNEKEVITALNHLKTNTKLIEAFKTVIAERYAKPETIYLTKEMLEYQEFLAFILYDPDKEQNDWRLHNNLIKMQGDLKQWDKDGHPTGRESWKKIQEQYKEKLKDIKPYTYPENLEVIEELFNIIEKLIYNRYSLTYKDFLEKMPHGIDLLTNILNELKEDDKELIKLLRKYLGLISKLNK